MSHFPESAFRRLLSGAPTGADVNAVGGTDTVGHSSVQAWSAGDIFPATIAVIESYRDPADYRLDPVPATLAERLRWTAYDLTLDGRTERFSSYDDARMVGARLVADPVQRDLWNNAEEN